MKPRLLALSVAALALAGCGDDTQTPAADAGADVRRGPPECPPGGNVCGCADEGPPDFSRAESGTPTDTSDERQRAALIRTNYWRTAAGLEPIHANAQLETAAMAHSTFMATNPSSCWPGAHYENAGSCMGYTGRTPFDRIGAAGYRAAAAGEVINWESTPERAIDGWIWTVYHRTPFQDPTYTEAGFAAAPGRPGDPRRFHNTMEFGRSAGMNAPALADVSVFPPPGTTNVPTAFQGNLEGPTPPTPATGAWPSGQVISLMFPSTNFTIETHRLLDGECNPVDHSTFRAARVADGVVADSRADANNSNARFVFLYGDRRLANNTRYTVEIRGTLNGAPWYRVWAFTTAP